VTVAARGGALTELDVEDLLNRLTESVTVYDQDGRLRYVND
jgi:hypothetical protein